MYICSLWYAIFGWILFQGSYFRDVFYEIYECMYLEDQRDAV